MWPLHRGARIRLTSTSKYYICYQHRAGNKRRSLRHVRSLLLGSLGQQIRMSNSGTVSHQSSGCPVPWGPGSHWGHLCQSIAVCHHHDDRMTDDGYLKSTSRYATRCERSLRDRSHPPKTLPEVTLYPKQKPNLTLTIIKTNNC